MTHNNISYLEVLEKKRSNLAQEAETHRANVAKEANTVYSVDVDAGVRREAAQLSADTSQLVAGINRGSQERVAQINAGASVANARVNAETQRYITDVNAGLRQQEIDETYRHNVVNEDVSQTENVIRSLELEDEKSRGWAKLEQDEYFRGVAAEQNAQSIQSDFSVGAAGVLARILPALAGLTS